MKEQQNQLNEALLALENKYNAKTGIMLLTVKEDYYIVERTLIELGVMKGDKNRTAHKAFIEMMDEIGFSFRHGRPLNKDMVRAVQSLSKAPYPWEAADNQLGRDYTNELPRRRLIYQEIVRAIGNNSTDNTANNPL